MLKKEYSIRDKALFLVSGVMIVFALSAGGLFIYSEQKALMVQQESDKAYSNFAYNQIFERQRLNDIMILNDFIMTPGFSEAFKKRDRIAIIRLWNSRWDAIKGDNITILQLHESNGRSLVRMHEQSHYGDMIATKRPMIASVHNTHIGNSGFETGIYGLAYRVAVPVFIDNKYEGALEIGSNPVRLTTEIHDLADVAGAVLIPHDPLLKDGVYTNSLLNHWIDGAIGLTSKLISDLQQGTIVNSSVDVPNNFYRYQITLIPLKNYQGNEVAKALFIRDNTEKVYSALMKIFLYGVAALSLAFVLLFMLRKWLGTLIGQLEKSNFNLTGTLQQLDRYKNVLDHHNIVTKSDLHGVITYVNDKFCEISGYTREELIGKTHAIVKDPSTPIEVYDEMWSLLKQNKTWKGILKNRHKDGSYYYLDTYIAPLFNEFGNVVEYIAVRHDITELISKREDLERIATTDPLTGLGNRFALVDTLKTIDHPALALIDIDHFSEINDFYGQRIGDEVIIELSRILRAVTAKRLHLYRIGSDVFALMCDHMDKELFLALLHQIGSEIRSKPLVIADKMIQLETTIGISFERSEKILTTVDMALTIGKKQKRPFVIYAEELSLEKEYENNIRWAIKIKKAIEEDRIVIYCQPIYNNETGLIEKYEVLVRMIDEDHSVISPFLFLDIAKKSKQYHDITKKVIKKAFEKFKDETVSFSINLTIEDILSSDCNTYFFNMLDIFKLHGRVVIELVESEGIENFDEVIRFIDRAKEHGCTIAIDDFGTGYSNFEYLLQLKPDFVKIDGSIIKHINKDANSLEVVKTIVDFAQRTNIQTIAEYVCDEAVYTTVKELGINYSQGYFIGEPQENLVLNKE